MSKGSEVYWYNINALQNMKNLINITIHPTINNNASAIDNILVSNETYYYTPGVVMCNILDHYLLF